jgi:D-alanyl-lipoteichoic acid acyltransferase DltB (MBOAT superfamily)
MPFNSISFLVFLFLVYCIYRLLPRKAQNVFLLISSYVFYGWWDIRFLSLIVLSTSLDFVSGWLITDGSIDRKILRNVSLWVIASSFLFLVIRWKELGSGTVFWKPGGRLFLAIAVLMIGLNVGWRRIMRLEMAKKRKIFLLLSISGNLMILGFFKYYNFFAENIEQIARGVGLNPVNLRLNIILPVGISFFTFMTMSYSIDVYRGHIRPTREFIDYSLFVAFFPKLLAGPIERAGQFLPQIAEKRKISSDDIRQGLNQILLGFFKKIVIADGVAGTVRGIFESGYPISWAEAVGGTLLFSFQIYGDFSGYSDIAIGTARLFGFKLMKNFNLPYFSRNASEFWGRWHISLSSWFRDYVFFPLGGPYGKTIRWIRNVLVTFVVTGLWHGAGWNFVLWGLYHGGLLCLHRLRESVKGKKRLSKRLIGKGVRIFGFFVLTSAGWILFRAQSMDQIRRIFRTIVLDIGNMKVSVEMPNPAAIIGILMLFVIEFIGFKNRGKSIDDVISVPIWTAVDATLIFLIIMSLANVPVGFIYFVF